MTEKYPWWLWLNVLSLDAPIIAVVWQRFFACVAGLRVPVATSIALAMAVWSLYLIDRQLDAREVSRLQTDRHRFARDHPRLIARLAALGLYFGTTSAFLLPRSHLFIGVLIAALALGYFAGVHLLRIPDRFAGLKELCVGLVFSAGIAIPVIAASSRTDWNWIPGVAAFAGLCSLNCLLISLWEEGAGEMGMVVTIGMFTSIIALRSSLPLAGAIFSSLVFLAFLYLVRTRFTRRSLRVLADAVLLTPLAVLVLT